MLWIILIGFGGFCAALVVLRVFVECALMAGDAIEYLHRLLKNR